MIKIPQSGGRLCTPKGYANFVIQLFDDLPLIGAKGGSAGAEWWIAMIPMGWGDLNLSGVTRNYANKKDGAWFDPKGNGWYCYEYGVGMAMLAWDFCAVMDDVVFAPGISTIDRGDGEAHALRNMCADIIHCHEPQFLIDFQAQFLCSEELEESLVPNLLDRLDPCWQDWKAEE